MLYSNFLLAVTLPAQERKYIRDFDLFITTEIPTVVAVLAQQRKETRDLILLFEELYLEFACLFL